MFIENWAYKWKSYSKKVILNSRTISIFPAIEVKKLVLLGKILRHFNIILHIWLVQLLFRSLDITAMINILQEVTTILQHEKMLKAINL